MGHIAGEAALADNGRIQVMQALIEGFGKRTQFTGKVRSDPRNRPIRTQVGQLHADAAQLLGLPVGIPVTSAGHDTPFALFGSGAGMTQPVLSSGTWEIPMGRPEQVDTASLAGFAASTLELASATGLYNPGLQWLTSGGLEWVKETCWKGANPGEVYEQMIAEATAFAPGCDGVTLVPDLLVGGGGVGGGASSGLSINSSRCHSYRATLEALSATLAH